MRPRVPLWQAEHVPAKIWEGLLPASRFSARTGIGMKQPIRSITVAVMSARLNILNSPDAKIIRVPGSEGHLPQASEPTHFCFVAAVTF